MVSGTIQSDLKHKCLDYFYTDPYAGLEKNGELNIDVLDQQPCENLCEETFSYERELRFYAEGWEGNSDDIPFCCEGCGKEIKDFMWEVL